MVWNYYFISARWLPPLRINKVKVKVKVGHIHYDVVLLLRPESYSLFSLSSRSFLVMLARFQQQKP